MPDNRMEAIVDIIKDLVYPWLGIYITDLSICASTYEEHIRDLKKVLQRLDKEKFNLKESKGQFFTGT